jgi:hypothetical protein
VRQASKEPGQPIKVGVESAPIQAPTYPTQLGCRDLARRSCLPGQASAKSHLTLEVDIDHGRVVPRGPEGLPEKGSGLLTILRPASTAGAASNPSRSRVELPLVRGDGKRIVHPMPEELDASL